MKKKTIIFIIIGFILTIIITATITTLVTKNKEQQHNNKININTEENQKQEDEIKENLKVDNKKENNEDNEEVIKNTQNNISKPDKPTKSETKDESNNSAENNEVVTNEELPVEPVKSEADVVKYIENISLEGSTQKLKDGFVTVVDFLFYDGAIYGKTFKELSNSAKIKVIAASIKIDSKIEEYFPGYKEKISDTTSKTYTKVKSKLVTMYLDTTVKICNENETLCEDAKLGLAELKHNFGLTWDFIKDISGVGLSKLKNWYEIWKEE